MSSREGGTTWAKLLSICKHPPSFLFLLHRLSLSKEKEDDDVNVGQGKKKIQASGGKVALKEV